MIYLTSRVFFWRGLFLIFWPPVTELMPHKQIIAFKTKTTVSNIQLLLQMHQNKEVLKYYVLSARHFSVQNSPFSLSIYPDNHSIAHPNGLE